MVIAPLFAALLDLNGTTITIVPSDDPTAIAEVHIQNIAVNTEKDNGVYFLPSPEITLDVEFTYNDGEYGADRITVIPPDDVICDPIECSVLVLETFEATIILKPYMGF